MRKRLTRRAMYACLLGLFAAVGVSLFLTACFTVAQPANEPKLPDGLRHVPIDAVGFVHIRAGDFLKTEHGKQILQEARKDRQGTLALKKVEESLGMEIADVDTVTVVMLPMPTRAEMNAWEGNGRGPGFFPTKPSHKDFRDRPRRDFDKDMMFKDKDFKEAPPKEAPKEKFDEKAADGKFSPVVLQDRMHQHDPDIDPFDAGDYMRATGPLVIVRSTKALDRRKIIKSQLFPAQARDGFGPSNGPSMIFLSDNTILVGQSFAVARYSEVIARPAPKERPMAKALALAATPHLIVAGGHLPATMRNMMMSPFGPDAEIIAALSPLLQTESAMTIDFDKSLELGLLFHAPNDVSASNALQAVKSMRVAGELALEKGRDKGEPGGWLLDLEKAAAKALKEATIEQKGTTVTANLKVDMSPSMLKQFSKSIVAAIRSVRSMSDRTQSINNLKNIALAMHSYHDVNKRMPPAGLSSIKDPTGKPLLSWRVAILPYIDEQPLYQAFDHTQPWDHPTNKKLIPRMPRVYMISSEETEPGMTHYRVLVGPGTAFELGQRIAIQNIVDGSSNTIMAVEAKDPTIWTKPDDLPYDPKGPLPKFGVSPEGFNAAFCDATVRFVRAGTREEVIRAMITRNGGEAVDLPD